MLIGTDAGLVGLPVGGNLEYQEETHLSDLVTTWPSHMLMPGIEPMLQQWEASILPMRQSDSHVRIVHHT